VTSTYNKEKYFKDAIESVLEQTRRDWRWWIILDGANHKTTEIALNLMHREDRVTIFTERCNYFQRKQTYRPAEIMNKYFPMISTDYFCWLSDDDVLMPNFLEVLCGTLDSNPNINIAYGGCKYIVETEQGNWELDKYVGVDGRRFDADSPPMYKLDGNQFVQTKESYNEVNFQFPNDLYHQVGDGLYLNELSKKYTIHSATSDILINHRRTFLSENDSA